jgi:uncharacterized protein (DUF342 family)
LHAIGRAVGKDHVVVHLLLKRHGGIAPPVRRRSRRVLALAEREDISRGIVSGQSCRVIASSARLATALCSLKIAKETEMTLKADQRAEIVAKVKQFTTDLSLSDEQKEKLKTALTEARERLEQYRKENPTISREEVTNRIAISRTAIRERVVSFLTTEQLSRWDAMAKLKNFLGQKAA